jgi:hypothetical protein
MKYDRYVCLNALLFPVHCTFVAVLSLLSGDVTVTMYSNANTNILVDLGYFIEIYRAQRSL